MFGSWGDALASPEPAAEEPAVEEPAAPLLGQWGSFLADAGDDEPAPAEVGAHGVREGVFGHWGSVIAAGEEPGLPESDETANVSEELAACSVDIPKGPPVKKQRGRPNKRVEAALEHFGASSSLPPASSGASDMEQRPPAAHDLLPAPRASAAPCFSIGRPLAMPSAIKVSARLLDRLDLASVHGTSAPHPLGPLLAHVASVYLTDPKVCDDELVADISHRFASPEHPVQHVATKELASEGLGTTRKTLTSTLTRIAAGAIFAERSAQRGFEAFVAARIPEADRISYVECARYDETPMSASMKIRCGLAVEEPEPAAGESAVVPSASDRALANLLSKWQTKLRSSPLKILQSENTYGMLVRVGGQFVTLLSSALCPLQVLRSTKGHDLAEAQGRVSAVSPVSPSFAEKCRAACLDKASSNAPAERTVVGRRGPDWKSSLLPCGVHITATCHTRTFSHLELKRDVSGLLNIALSVRDGTRFTLFQDCLRDVVQERIEILAGRPSAAAVHYRRTIMRMFVPKTGHHDVSTMLLSSLPNGDWRNSERVEFFPDVGPAELRGMSREDVGAFVAEGCLVALCHAQFHIYPRSRWTGADVAVSELGLLASVHNLLQLTFEEFCKRIDAPGSSVRDEGNAEAEEPLAEVAPGAAEGTASDGALQVVVAGSIPAPDEAAIASGHSSAEDRAKFRGFARQYLRLPHLGRVMLLRVAMEPLRELLAAQFYINSERWEQEQQGLVVGAFGEVPKTYAGRDYKMTVAASGAMEEQVFARLKFLFAVGPDFWGVVPNSSCTVAFRSLTFRTLARTGCLVEELIGTLHRGFPFRMFRLLMGEELWADFKGVPPCLLDAWSSSVVERYRHLESPSDELMALLQFHARIRSIDISSIEARHAAVRRLLEARSVQTHRMSFADASTNLVCGRMRWRNRAATKRERNAV